MEGLEEDLVMRFILLLYDLINFFFIKWTLYSMVSGSSGASPQQGLYSIQFDHFFDWYQILTNTIHTI